MQIVEFGGGPSYRWILYFRDQLGTQTAEFLSIVAYKLIVHYENHELDFDLE